jgi:monoamine oxidase
LIGGNQQIPNKLATSLTNVIELNTVLEGIRTLSDGRYRVSLRSGNTTFDRTYERILLTIPFSVLRQVKLDVKMSPVKRLAIDTLSYGTNSKLAVSYRQATWRSQQRATGSILTDLPFQNTWEASASHYRAGTQGLLINFTGGTQGVNIGAGNAWNQATKFQSQLTQVFPETASNLVPNQVLRAYWYGQLYSQGSYACYRPGQWTRFYGVERTRVANIFFAGEHCSLAFQGYMEGAVRTGEGAAKQILQSLGLPLPPTTRSVDQEKLHPRRLPDTYPLN